MSLGLLRNLIRSQKNLLHREVKMDGKGLFVHFGGYRFSPQRKTRAVLGDWVEMESPFNRYDQFTVVIVGGVREKWKHRTQRSKHDMSNGKHARFTRQYFYAWYHYISLVKAQ